MVNKLFGSWANHMCTDSTVTVVTLNFKYLHSLDVREDLCLKYCKCKGRVSLFFGFAVHAIFVCPALRFIPNEPRPKDTQSLINDCW